MNPNTVTTGEVRLSYTDLFQPRASQLGAEPKYSVTVLVPKSDTATKAAIDAAMAYAVEQGVGKKWGGVRPPQPNLCIHDGDGPRPSDGQPYGAECRGCWVFTASSNKPPFVVDLSTQPIINQAEVYSGMYGRVSINFFPYSASGKKGIGCGLNGVQKMRDGEPLAGHVSVEEAFGAPIYSAAPPVAAYTPPAYPGFPTAQPAAPINPVYDYAPPAPVYTAPVYGAPIDPITGQPIYQPPVMGQ